LAAKAATAGRPLPAIDCLIAATAIQHGLHLMTRNVADFENESQASTSRARGWLRVMQLDAWGSMVVYTVVTIAFYLLGAATLGRLGLRPEGSEMVRTLGQMYVPIFGEWVREVFLLGAFAVLYSTFFVAAAGNARLVTDGLTLAGRLPDTPASRRTWVGRLSMAWALVATGLALFFQNPVAMVLASGIAQAIMLAAIAVAVLFFRYRDLDPRLLPTRAWDLLLWISAIGFLIIGGWTGSVLVGLFGEVAGVGRVAKGTADRAGKLTHDAEALVAAAVSRGGAACLTLERPGCQLHLKRWLADRQQKHAIKHRDRSGRGGIAAEHVDHRLHRIVVNRKLHVILASPPVGDRAPMGPGSVHMPFLARLSCLLLRCHRLLIALVTRRHSLRWSLA
jgi:hypothetical protein